LDDQRRGVDIGENFTGRRNMNPPGRADRAARGPGNDDLADAEIAIHLAAVDDQVPFGDHGAIELAVDAEGGLEAELSLDVAAVVEEAVEVALFDVGFEDHR